MTEKQNQLVSKFISNPTYLDKGSGHLADRMKVSRNDIIIAKAEARRIIKLGEDTERSNYITTLEEQLTKVNNEKGTLESTIESIFEPKDDIELAKLHKIDLTKYKISNYWSKLKPNGKFTSSVLATLRKVDKDISLQKDVLIKELVDSIKPIALNKVDNKDKVYAYEINIPDHHFGKMAWSEESGEDYDLKIAETRYTNAVENLMSLVDNSKIEKIIFPIGNDMLNIDSRKNETFAGTSQDSDSRFFKIVRAVKNILIKTINSLSVVAPVDVIVISGNHDPESMFMIGEILDAFYHNNKNVNINNQAVQRKYYKYGKCGFQYTHGNEEKHGDLGLIFATEQSKLWADTEFRFCKLGHYHKNKKMTYISIDEHQGFQVQILPSLSGSDAWHASKGYNSKKQAKAFLYHKEGGQIGEFTYNLVNDK